MFDHGVVTLNARLTNSLRSVELFINELNDALQDPWTTEDMAKACGLGITRFTHLFRQITNQTPMQYLHKMRLKKAENDLFSMLVKSIADIIFSCGFSSTHYFATLFKKHTNQSPSAYRSE